MADPYAGIPSFGINTEKMLQLIYYQIWRLWPTFCNEVHCAVYLGSLCGSHKLCGVCVGWHSVNVYYSRAIYRSSVAAIGSCNLQGTNWRHFVMCVYEYTVTGHSDTWLSWPGHCDWFQHVYCLLSVAVLCFLIIHERTTELCRQRRRWLAESQGSLTSVL